jgi:hypothetical protein
MGDISSGNIKSVDVFSVECEVEGVEYEVLRELPATSELKAQSEAVCVADPFRDSSAPTHGLCSSVAPTKSKSSKVFLFNRCRPVDLKPLVAIFPVCTSSMHYQKVQILRNALLRAYSATANALFLLRSSASVVP